MSSMSFWPCEPSMDEVVLVRAEGLDFIKKVRELLDEYDCGYIMGGKRKDSITFYVDKDRLEAATRFIKLRIK